MGFLKILPFIYILIVSICMRVILIHGFNASPEMNFHPWLKESLVDLGFEVISPDLPLSSKEEINLPDVIEKIKDKVGYLKNDDIILGHSLGAFIALQYLEAVEMTETPRAVILVAAPWKVTKQELRRLFIADLDADVLMWKAREYVIIHSKDDTLVPFEHGKKLAGRLKARLVEAESDGHYMDAKYPILLDTIKQISKTPFEFEPGMSLVDDFKELEM
jgi:predicted alpha/beta hydrolase family esterase